MKIYWFYSLIAIACLSCGKKTGNALRTYYFPLDSLREGLVYEYRRPDKAIDHYCFYKSLESDNKRMILVNTRYNGAFQQDMIIREQEVGNGMTCTEYRFLVPDSTGKVDPYIATIEEKVLFPFELTQDSSAPYRFKMNFALPPDLDVRYAYTRNRHFKRFTEYEWQGKKLPAVEFYTTEHTNMSDAVKGGNWDVNATITEIYAQGIGLVSYKKQSSSDSIPAIYQLEKRMTMEEFMQLSK